MAGMDLPSKAIREQISSAIDLLVHQERMFDGSRRIVNITEVQGMENDTIILQDIFNFQQQGMDGRRLVGGLRPVGIRPKFLQKLELHGVRLPPTVFGTERARLAV